MNKNTINISQSTIAIGILARDCAESLKLNIPLVEQLGLFFKDYFVAIYENDSKDNTKDIIEQWQQTNKHVLAVMENHHTSTIIHDKCPARYSNKRVSRIKKMATYRNHILDIIRVNYSPDIFCFIDIDILRFNPLSVIKAITDAPCDWGALFSRSIVYIDFYNGSYLKPQQYDTYAYVDYNVDPMKAGKWYTNRFYNKVTGFMLNQDIKKNIYMPCNSAFNGLGIYRWNDIKELRYDVYQPRELKALDVCLCEHVMFNLALIKKGYTNYIVQFMETEYQHEKKNGTISPIFIIHPELRFFIRYSSDYLYALWCRIKRRLHWHPYQTL